MYDPDFSRLKPLLLAASIASMLLTVTACELLTPDDTIAPETPDQVLARVMTGVSELRGLDFLEPVDVEYLSPHEIETYLQGLLGDEEREELYQLEELLSTLGLLGADVNLVALYLDLLSEGVLGAYDPEENRLVVRLEDNSIGPSEELTLAHELTHVLQQQHFDIHSLLKDTGDNFDLGLAVSTLAEGDATMLEIQYLQEFSLTVPNPPDTPVYNSAPPIIQQLLLFPYIQGVPLVRSFEAEQWEGVNSAYQHPPRSTEQVLHPGKYHRGELPSKVTLPSLDGLLDSEWEPIFSSVGGEFLIAQTLRSSLSQQEAEKAASGWGGDTFALYTSPTNQRLLLWSFQWDSPRDASEFFQAYVRLTGDDGQHPWNEVVSEVPGQEDTRRWVGAGQWLHLQKSGNHTGLIIAPYEDVIRKLAPLLQTP